MPDGSYSVSDIQDYVEYIIKKHETLTTNTPIYGYINRINNGLVFKVQDGYKLELQTPKTRKLFGCTTKLISVNNGLVFKIQDGYKLELQTPKTRKLFGSTTKLISVNNGLVFKIQDGYKLELQTPKTMKLFGSTTKNGENVPSLEVVEVVLVQFNLVDNKYQQNSEVLYTFTLNKSYAYLLDVEASNLMFLKTYNTEFDKIIITFNDQNGRPLEKEEKVNLTLLINK